MPASPLHILLASVGTDGDVFPFLGLGARLRARGHRVTLATQAPYRAAAEVHGFEFVELFTQAETEEAFEHPDLWHPLKGAFRLARWGSRLLARQYDVLAEQARSGTSLFVAGSGLLAARLVQEKLGQRLATVILQPWMIPSLSAPPVMPAGLTLPSWAPRPVGRLYFRLLDLVGDVLMGRNFNALRARLGLKPVRRPFQWWLSPERVLGMFPDWYGPPQLDWPPQIRLTCFPLYDGRIDAALPEDVTAFLREGPPPIAFTFGTGMRQAHELFANAVEACRRLGARGLLLTRHAAQVPEQLPAFMRHCSFAPFRLLFPHCAAVVHHGGIGTVSRALAAGTPQLVLPFAYDQKDNSVRVKRLGVGDWLGRRKRDSAAMAAALRQLGTDALRERCRDIASRFDKADGLDEAVKCVEAMA